MTWESVSTSIYIDSFAGDVNMQTNFDAFVIRVLGTLRVEDWPSSSTSTPSGYRKSSLSLHTHQAQRVDIGKQRR